MTLQSPGAARPEIARLGPWFHNLHLPDGGETAPDHPLGDFPAFKWRQLAPALPDVRGWRALDVGCNAGYYAFELAHRGATVVGIDSDEHYLRQARWARSLYGLEERVELRRQTVYDLARSDERFDLVLFMGVLYHLRYPLLGLDLVAEKAERLLVLQTLTAPEEEAVEPPADVPFEQRARLVEPGWPKAAFVERSLAGDPTNWWVPTPSAVEAMARAAGLDPYAHPAEELWLCRPTGRAEHRAEVDAATGRARRA